MKLLKLVCLHIICVMAMITLFSATAFANEAIINNDHLNVRTGPGTDFDKVDQVHTNEVYPIIQTKGEWVEIQLNDQSGWVMTEYITIEQEEDEEVEESEKHVYVPTAATDDSVQIVIDNTHIREGPSTDDKITLFAEKDDIFTIVSEDDDWYEVELKRGTGYLFKKLVQQQTNQINHLQGKKIVIDAGHGGRDVGSISISELYEKDFTLKSSIALKETLTMLGANVVLTRENDDYIRLASRPALSNIHTADAFISIHYNSFPDLASVSGIDTYYYDDHDQQLAQIIQQEIINETEANDRGIDYGNFQVLRQNFQPSVLLELGFISNENEEQLLLTNAYQEKIVNGIVSGLTKYFSANEKAQD